MNGGLAEYILAHADHVAHIRRALGHLAIQYAEAMGLRVCAVDIDDVPSRVVIDFMRS